jgi:hypothetical protein
VRSSVKVRLHGVVIYLAGLDDIAASKERQVARRIFRTLRRSSTPRSLTSTGLIAPMYICDAEGCELDDADACSCERKRWEVRRFRSRSTPKT